MRIPDFIYRANPGRVLFGAGSVQRLENEVQALGATRALVLCSPAQRELGEAIAFKAGNRAIGVFSGAAMHVPIQVVTEAQAVARSLHADCAIVIGGGSAIGLGKAIALKSDLPIIAIPTTYAGSEMTPIYGITEAGIKNTGTSHRVLPRAVIYDPELTLSLPVAMSVTSGINALAHAAEGLYAPDANPVTSLLAEEAIAALAKGIPAVCADGSDVQARQLMLYGAWLAGTVLGSVGMALHHKLCHTLGGSFGLPHAETHTIVLPHALAYNARAAPEAMNRIANALGTVDASRGAFDLAQTGGTQLALRDIGMSESDLDRAAKLASSSPYPNPRPVEQRAIRALLQDAFEGRAPKP
ncbi:maleylacetate reductase [Paraburkholderia sediminicola]|uniref:maleylacetate reductase n=1 Tax=Paraburkholderia sediminicola TaxID=458836 RepID=UPI0038B921FB